MARWHLLEPWVADVALSTLLKWDRLAVEQSRATSFALVPRPKTAQHNVITYNFPKLAAEDLAFSFSYNANWDMESERFASFQDAFMQAAREALNAFKRNIDEKMLEAGYVQVTGRTNIHNILPFRWLALYQVRGASFAQITKDDLRDRKRRVKTEKEEEAFAHQFEQRQEAIVKATQRVAKRIGLALKPTNQN